MQPKTDWNQVMEGLAGAIAREVALELQTAIAAAVAQAMKEAAAPAPLRPGTWPAMMSLRQAAEYIGIPYGTVRRWRRDNLIPIGAVRLGKKSVRYKRLDLDRWIESRKELK